MMIEENEYTRYTLDGFDLSAAEYWEIRNVERDIYEMPQVAQQERKYLAQVVKENGFVSIPEFAELAGVTVQSVYKKIKSNRVFAAYVYVFEDTKLIRKDAVKFFTRKSKQKEVDKPSESLEKIAQLEEQIKQAALVIEKLKLENKTLQDEITLKNAEIASFKKKIEALNLKQQDLVDKLVSSTLKQNELIENTQKLMAYQLQQLNQPAQVVEPEAEVIEVYKPKKGFFSKLFK